MRTEIRPADPVEAAPSGMARVVPGANNAERITRLFGLCIGFGYLGYLLLLSPSIAALMPYVASWWTPVTIVVVFGPGAVLAVVARRGSLATTRRVAAVAALSFFVGVITFPLAWNGVALPSAVGMWLAAFPGLASMAAVVAWPGVAAFVQMVVACVSVQVLEFVAHDGQRATALLPNICFAVMFCSLFVFGVMMSIRTGRILDETTDETHATAAAAAAVDARSVERERFDALIHDSVMSTLLAASRPGTTDVPALATGTLAELDEIRAGVETDRPFSLSRAVVHLRATAAAADAGARFAVAVDERGAGERDDPIPAEAVRAVGAAVAEALRNSLRHAGKDAHRAVEGTVGPSSIEVAVTDDGAGFDPSSVSARRLGIAVSIRGRMDRLPGGSARIESVPGSGTTVRLDWERP